MTTEHKLELLSMSKPMPYTAIVDGEETILFKQKLTYCPKGAKSAIKVILNTSSESGRKKEDCPEITLVMKKKGDK